MVTRHAVYGGSGAALAKRLRQCSVSENGCRLWTKGAFHDGYGALYWVGKMRRVHRLAYEVHKGPIPEGMCVCHTCDRPRCVNPRHLWLGTAGDNNADTARKDRVQHGERHANARLSANQVREIFAAEGFHSVVARDFDVSRETVSRIKRKSTWRRVHQIEV